MRGFKPEFVKFRLEQVSSKGPTNRNVQYIRLVCNQLDKYGLVAPYQTPEGVGSNGNVSYRLTPDDRFVITATQLPSKRNLRGKDFVIVDRYEMPTEPTDRGTAYYHGQRLPSSESILHWYFYNTNRVVEGIVHAHEETELLYSPRSRAVWNDLGIVETERIGEEGTIDLPKSVEEVLKDLSQYTVLLKHHPPWDEAHTGVLTIGTGINGLTKALDRALDVHGELVSANRVYPGATPTS